jgi:hypothetical protein
MRRTLFTLVLLVPFVVASNVPAQVSVDSIRFLAQYPSILQFQEYERIFERHEEIVALYFANGDQNDWKSGRELVAEAADSDKALLAKIRKAKIDPLYATLRDMQAEVVELGVSAFHDLYSHGPESKQFKQANDIYQPELQAYLDKLVSMTEDGFFEIDSASEVALMEAEYNRVYPNRNEILRTMKGGDPAKALAALRAEPDFQKNDVARLLAADILLKKRYDSLLTPELQRKKDETGVKYLWSILGQHTYSPVLYEAWRKWRAMTQMDYGASHSSEIPNGLYDSTRFAILRMIGQHIEQNPHDLWAYRQFFCILEVEIIHRFGPYEYGNQSAVERGILFYNAE